MLIEPMSKFALSHYGIREKIQLEMYSSDSAGKLMRVRWIQGHWGAEGSVCIMMSLLMALNTDGLFFCVNFHDQNNNLE